MDHFIATANIICMCVFFDIFLIHPYLEKDTVKKLFNPVRPCMLKE